jgi:serine/threonine protein phosphatase 1
MRPTIIIGDVHGSYEQLAPILSSDFATDRDVIFVGDLIDRGPHSSKVLDLIIERRRQPSGRVLLIRGNHEQALLDFIDGTDAATFLKNGGLSTIASYYRDVPDNVLSAFRQDFPMAHLDLVRSSVTHLETSEILISHMGYDPRNPLARDASSMTLVPHHDIFSHSGNPATPLTVCGHYAQKNAQPFISDSLICIDTGCGTFPSAPLSALLLPERTVVQSDAEGKLSEWSCEVDGAQECRQ